MSADHAENLRRLFENSWSGDYSLVDAFVSPDYVDHSTIASPQSGIEGFKQRIGMLRQMMPDVRFVVDDIFASGDKVAFRWTARGTDTGGFMGRPPTGNAINVTGVNIEQMKDGKIIEHWSAPDNLTMMRQLGIIPTPGKG
jgi:steroid delta-isomerase-like uncharacterized protein